METHYQKASVLRSTNNYFDSPILLTFSNVIRVPK
jgi:hypothetical protein